MTSVNIKLLTAAEDLEVTQEEVESMVMGVAESAITSMVLMFMVYMFGMGIGMKKKDIVEYEKMAEKL